MRRFRATLRQDAGKSNVFYGKAYDPHRKWAAEMTHGLTVQPSLIAGHLVNPYPNTRFQQGLFDRKEEVYASRKQPVGSSHDQRPGLPPGMNMETTTYGIPTEKGECLLRCRSRNMSVCDLKNDVVTLHVIQYYMQDMHHHIQ